MERKLSELEEELKVNAINQSILTIAVRSVIHIAFDHTQNIVVAAGIYRRENGNCKYKLVIIYNLKRF